MRLTDFCDLSLRVLIYVALQSQERATISDITQAYRVSRNHLVKVVQHLGALGYLETFRGRGGGVRLAPGTLELRLGQVVRQCEPDFQMVECFGPAERNCVLSNACALQNKLTEALDAFMRVLDSVTLGEMVKAPSPMVVRLFPAGSVGPHRRLRDLH